MNLRLMKKNNDTAIGFIPMSMMKQLKNHKRQSWISVRINTGIELITLILLRFIDDNNKIIYLSSTGAITLNWLTT